MTAVRASSGRSDIEQVAQEKNSVAHSEFQQNSGMSPEDADFLANFPEERKKKAVRKVDFRLVPMLVLLYLMAYLDKTNIGNAKIEGLLDSLHMTGIDYNIALSVFFIPFVLAEVPSNMVLHMFKRPSLYIGGIVTCWGIVMTCNGVVQNFGGLVAVRIFLGLFEAGFLPGAILIISKWYLPNETQTQIAILYTSAASGGAFSGLLAFAIAKMDGVGGYEGWRWIFILEGLATWLDPEEIRFLELRQQARRVVRPNEFRDHHFDKHAFLSVLTDWKIYLLILANWSNVSDPAATKANSENIKDNIALNYFAICLACFGMYPILPGVNAWNVANTPSPTKRAISIGFLVCVGNIGGLIGSYIYMDKEAPRYPTGYGTSFGFASAGILAVITLEALLYRRNKKKELMTEDEVSSGGRLSASTSAETPFTYHGRLAQWQGV
ncbi:major facilitator superfamily transporter [Colletotrichum sp. SAR11_59]|nr:major facilitator superfamily transporter [Colletotrichum sp. SAR11_59]